MWKKAPVHGKLKGKLIIARHLGTLIYETVSLVGYSYESIVSTYWKWRVDNKTVSHQLVVWQPQCTALISEDSRECHVLFILAERLQWPKSPAARRVMTQMVYLNTHCSIRTYAASRQFVSLCWQRAMANSICSGSRNILALNHRRIEESCLV